MNQNTAMVIGLLAILATAIAISGQWAIASCHVNATVQHDTTTVYPIESANP